MKIDSAMKNEIERLVLERLGRKLRFWEKRRVLKPRSLMGYESIIDYLKSTELSNQEIEHYLKTLNKKRTSSNMA